MTRSNIVRPPHIERATRTGIRTLWLCALVAALGVGLRFVTGNFSLLWLLPVCAVMVVLLVINSRALRTVREWGQELDEAEKRRAEPDSHAH